MTGVWPGVSVAISGAEVLLPMGSATFAPFHKASH